MMVKRNYSPEPTPQEIIKAYTEARRRAGTIGDGMPSLSHANGWYRVGYGSYRRADILAMTENLNARAPQEAK